jgi:hypothetical protein
MLPSDGIKTGRQVIHVAHILHEKGIAMLTCYEWVGTLADSS